MKYQMLAVWLMTVGLFLASNQAFAHHSESAYDTETLVTVTGTITQFEFINPHQLIHFEVKDPKGNVVQWIAFGSSPKALTRIGWNSHIIKPGDVLTITGIQEKSGRPIMVGLKLVRPNGEVLPGSEVEGKILQSVLDKQHEKKPQD